MLSLFQDKKSFAKDCRDQKDFDSKFIFSKFIVRLKRLKYFIFGQFIKRFINNFIKYDLQESGILSHRSQVRIWIVEKVLRTSDLLKLAITEYGDPVTLQDGLEPVGHRQNCTV